MRSSNSIWHRSDKTEGLTYELELNVDNEQSSGLVIIETSLDTGEHQCAVIELLNDYRADFMGGFLDPLDTNSAFQLIDYLHSHPTRHIFLAMADGMYVGLIVSFVTISTFKVRPLLNIHDIIVKKDYRKRGIGKKLLGAAHDFAQSIGCCRLTLEVREDNAGAKRLYCSAGFAPCEPPMEFWHWTI